MAIQAAILKRLNALECRLDGSNNMKVFCHYIEEDPDRWEPEDPASWQQSHPNGNAVILKFVDCGRK